MKFDIDKERDELRCIVLEAINKMKLVQINASKLHPSLKDKLIINQIRSDIDDIIQDLRRMDDKLEKTWRRESSIEWKETVK